MQFYLAPLEGVTGYIVRNAFAHYFPYIDKYFRGIISLCERVAASGNTSILLSA